MPPSTTALRTDLLSFRASGSAGLPLCVDDFGDPFEQAAPCLDDHAYVRPTLRARVSAWFTPPTLQIRCGGRWPELTRDGVLAHDPRVRFEGDGVWITAEPDAVCDDRPTYVWYRHQDGGVHHVRFPWRPSELAEGPRLFISQVAAGSEAPKGVTLVTQQGDSETRLALSAGHGDESRGFALLGDGKADKLKLDLGDALRQLTDPFAATASLTCGNSPGARVFQATRLAVTSPRGWLVGLATASPQGLSWNSTWQLGGTSVVEPWICEALPGDDPTYTQRIPFAPERGSTDLLPAAPPPIVRVDEPGGPRNVPAIPSGFRDPPPLTPAADSSSLPTDLDPAAAPVPTHTPPAAPEPAAPSPAAPTTTPKNACGGCGVGAPAWTLLVVAFARRRRRAAASER